MNFSGWTFALQAVEFPHPHLAAAALSIQTGQAIVARRKEEISRAHGGSRGREGNRASG